MALTDGFVPVVNGPPTDGQQPMADGMALATILVAADVTRANLDANGDIGIADDKIVEMDDADAADNDYAKFTPNGLEGRSYAEVRSDINVEDAADVTDAENVGAAIGGTGEDATPADADKFAQAGGTTLAHTTWGTIKSLLTTLFDAVYAPIAKGVTNGDSHDHSGGDGAAIVEAAITLADNTTNDSSTTKHGFLKKLDDDDTHFMNGKGAWAVPAGGGGGNIATGTYTGDGSTSQGITGVGFQPVYVRIWPHPAGEGAGMEVFEKTDQTWGDYAWQEGPNNDSQHEFWDNRINSLDADGFSVDDDGADAHPNKNSQVYDYLCLG